MPRASAQRSIRDARSLAQKLWSQCRDSSNGFKTLAQPLRKLRNVLEDYEESAAGDNAQWLLNTRFLLELDACSALLQELDLTLQSHRCSTYKWQDIHDDTITKLHNGITFRTEELEDLHGTIQAGELLGGSDAQALDDIEEEIPEQATPLVECDGDVFMIVAEPTRPVPADIPPQEEIKEQRPRRFSWEDDEGLSHDEHLDTVASDRQAALQFEDLPAPRRPSAAVDDLVSPITILNVKRASYALQGDVPSGPQQYNGSRLKESMLQDEEPSEHEQQAQSVDVQQQDTHEEADHAAEESTPRLDLTPRPAASTETDVLHVATEQEHVEPTPPQETHDVPQTAIQRTKSLTEDDWDAEFRDFATADSVAPIQMKQLEEHVAEQAEQAVSEDPASTLVSTPEPEDITRAIEVVVEEPESQAPSAESASSEMHLPEDDKSNEQPQDIPGIVPEQEDETSQATRTVDTKDEALESTAQVDAKPKEPEVHQQYEQEHSPAPQLDWRTPDVGSSLFRSPFAVFDPLSVDIDSASSFLLGAEAPEPVQYVAQSRKPSLAPAADHSSPVISEVHERRSVATANTSVHTKDDEDESWTTPIEQHEIAAPTVLPSGETVADATSPKPAPAVEDVGPAVMKAEDVPTEDVAAPPTVPEKTQAEAAKPVDEPVAQPSLPRKTEEAPANDTAGLGITFEPVSFEPTLQINGQAEGQTDEETTTEIRQQSAAPPAIVIARNDSVHAAQTTRPAEEALLAPASPIDQLMASFHEDENVIAEEEESTVTHLKARWLSLRSAPTKSNSHNIPRSKFSLQDKFRRVSFRTKTPASLPIRIDSKAANAIHLTGESSDPSSEARTPDEANTPLTSPLRSPTSPLKSQDKDLPAIPPQLPERAPPLPARAPPQVPVDVSAELDKFPAPPLPPPKTYRIVNPSPPSMCVPTDDDLYSSSRPATPTKAIPAESIEHVVSPIEDEAATAQDDAHLKTQDDDENPFLDERYFMIELEEPEAEANAETSAEAQQPESNASSAPSSLHESEQQQAPATSTVSPSSAPCNIDSERLERLCASWRNQNWDHTTSYLRGHLDAVLDQGDTDGARRVMHMLGVCTSYQGQWQKALGYFIAAVHAPVRTISNLDHGDFAAFYWLGDTYALLNRRCEALVAYTIALQIHNRRAGAAPSQTILLREEISSLLPGTTPQELILNWERMKKNGEKSMDYLLDRAILDPVVITASLAEAAKCLKTPKMSSKLCSRGVALSEYEGLVTIPASYTSSRITPESFKRGNPWPEPFDPTFVASNVAAGRLCDQPTDLLTALVTQQIYKVPRSGPVGSTRLDCFTCNHLDWLIVTVRQCLMFLEMRWDEIAHDRGSIFKCRFAVKSRSIITAHYFSISLFKQSMRAGYGVEVCVDGVKSSRILTISSDYINGVRASFDKRIRKLVRDYLTHAYRLWQKEGKKQVRQSMVPATSTAVREQAAGLLATSSLVSLAPVMPDKPVYA